MAGAAVAAPRWRQYPAISQLRAKALVRIALLTEGEYFGETDLVSDKPSDATIRTITPCVLLTLSKKDLDAVLAEHATLKKDFQKVIAEHQELRSTVNRYAVSAPRPGRFS